MFAMSRRSTYERVGPEDVLACLATLRTGRPIKWIEDRHEHSMAANHSRDQIHRLRAACFNSAMTISDFIARFLCGQTGRHRPVMSQDLCQWGSAASCSRLAPHAPQRLAQGVRALAQPLALFVRHVRL